MKVKKFRAATTREALEKIKMELGEDAFVLETKQVKTGGLMGFGGETQIEISAAVPNGAASGAPAPQPRGEKKSPSSSASAASVLGLTDNTPAMPRFSFQKKESSAMEALMPALAARAFLAEEDGYGVSGEFTAKNKFGGAEDERSALLRERGVEISEAAPRIVHARKESPSLPKREAAAAAASSENAAGEGDADDAAPAPKAVEVKQSQALAYELERLRAEMREVKFSLGAFAARQTAMANHSSQEIESQIDLFDSPFDGAYLDLISVGVPHEMARDAIQAMIPAGGDQFATESELAYCALLKSLSSFIRFGGEWGGSIDLAKQNRIVFVGATGVGKTTTLAKLAARAALRERRRVELVTLDTYRIAAVEQLKTYAEIIGAGFTVVRSALELDGILNRLPADAVVLIDTTGRSPHDLADQLGFSDYLRRREDILKCLVLQATTNPQDAVIAARKFALYGANCLALTKFDETTRPGASIQIAAEAALPLVYLCDGQRVPEDLEEATPAALAARIIARSGGEQEIYLDFKTTSLSGN